MTTTTTTMMAAAVVMICAQSVRIRTFPCTCSQHQAVGKIPEVPQEASEHGQIES
jgi:hypothetical protein